MTIKLKYLIMAQLLTHFGGQLGQDLLGVGQCLPILCLILEKTQLRAEQVGKVRLAGFIASQKGINGLLCLGDDFMFEQQQLCFGLLV
jgi:hypothetical protein